MHKLEELVDYSFEEFPMCFEETRILADDIHDVGSADGFIVFATLHLGEA